MNLDYSGENLIHRNWPTVSEGYDGMWYSTWTFELASQINAGIVLSEIAEEFSTVLSRIVRQVTKNPDETFTVSLRPDGIYLHLQTTTAYHLIGSEYMSAIIEMFKLVEQCFGRIELIQSQPRDLWPPWWKP